MACEQQQRPALSSRGLEEENALPSRSESLRSANSEQSEPYTKQKSPASASRVDADSSGRTSPAFSVSLKARGSMERLMLRARPRSLAKSMRPNSFLGSLWGSKGAPNASEIWSRRHTSSGNAFYAITDSLNEIVRERVILDAELQIANSIFKRKSQYVVLTTNNLIKFRNLERALDAFPHLEIRTNLPTGQPRHNRLSSTDSTVEIHAQSDPAQIVPLVQIIAVQSLTDGKSCFSIEISQLDEERMQASTSILQLQDAKEHDQWLNSLRATISTARQQSPPHFNELMIAHTVRLLEQENDYSPAQFYMFRVVERANKNVNRASADDLNRFISTPAILAIGQFKIHLVPLPRGFRAGSSSSLADLQPKAYGLASLTALVLQAHDDAYQLAFRIPLQATVLLSLASVSAPDCAILIRHASDRIRPLWPEHPFLWHVPEDIHYQRKDEIPSDDNVVNAFDQTLLAYCIAYNVDISNITYSEFVASDNSSTFMLQPPRHGQDYTILELLAILRALRYHDCFETFSLAHISLSQAFPLHDLYGHEHAPTIKFSDDRLSPGTTILASTVLGQELQALMTENRNLKRLDFTSCVARSMSQHHYDTGFCAALLPLCVHGLTNVDWITLNGNILSELDIDYLFSALGKVVCHFRAFEVSRCGLEERNLLHMLGTLAQQANTIQVIDLSGNGNRISASSLQRELRPFSRLRKLNLAELSDVTNTGAFLDAELLSRWQLEELILCRCYLNKASLAAIAHYLSSPMSAHLRLLDLTACQLTGLEVARLCEALNTQPNQCRHINIMISGNRLEEDHEAFVTTIRRDLCPSGIVLRGMEYEQEVAFERLLDALARNTNLKSLDIAGLSLQGDASHDTCQALGRLFLLNKALEYLDISGEQTHLMASRFGTGLNQALQQLKDNSSLQILKIEYQALGSEGIGALANALGENTHLKEIHLNHNAIDIAGLKVLADSLEHNRNLIYLSDMTPDREAAEETIRRGTSPAVEKPAITSRSIALGPSGGAAVIRRTMHRTIPSSKTMHVGLQHQHQRSVSSSTSLTTESSPQLLFGERPSLGSGFSPTGSRGKTLSPQTQEAVQTFMDSWFSQWSRIRQYLSRNATLIPNLSLDYWHSLHQSGSEYRRSSQHSQHEPSSNSKTLLQSQAQASKGLEDDLITTSDSVTDAGALAATRHVSDSSLANAIRAIGLHSPSEQSFPYEQKQLVAGPDAEVQV